MHKTVVFGGGGSGGGVNSSGSVSTLSGEENNMLMSSEDSSSYPDESELELGLGLSLGGGGGGKGKARPLEAAAGGSSWDQYARILTAKDFPAVGSTKASSSSSSSSSSSPVNKANNNGSCGTKRTAEPSSPPGRSTVSNQVVGWPPVRTYRMNSLVNNAKSPATDQESASTVHKCKNTNSVVNKGKYSCSKNDDVAKERGLLKKSLFVKVNMDGIPIGRKIDLNAHSCYESLAHSLDHMFGLSAAAGAKRQPGILLDGSSDFVLTYEDKDGDWMLVGDVPWGMFLSSVRRLRIRNS